MRWWYFACIWSLVFIALVCLFFIPWASVGPKERSIDVSTINKKLHLVSKSSQSSDLIVLDVDLDQNNNSILQLYYQYSLNEVSELDIELKLGSLIEFDSTYSVIFQNHDQILSEWPNYGQKVEWGNWINASMSVNNITVNIFTATTIDRTFLVSILASPCEVDIFGQHLDPNNIAVIFTSQAFSYKHKDTRLAFQIQLISETFSKTSGIEAAVMEKLPFCNHYSDCWKFTNIPFGSFSWNSKTNSSNSIVDLLTWSPSNDLGKEIDFAFTPFTNIHLSKISLYSIIGLDYQSYFCVGGGFFLKYCGISALVLIGFLPWALITPIITYKVYKKTCNKKQFQRY